MTLLSTVFVRRYPTGEFIAVWDALGLLETLKWCPEPESNRHGRLGPRDFKSDKVRKRE